MIDGGFGGYLWNCGCGVVGVDIKCSVRFCWCCSGFGGGGFYGVWNCVDL